MNTVKPLAYPVLSMLLLLLIGVPGQARADDGYDRVFIYGDSLSDAGNLFLLTGQVSLPPYLPVPSAPYEVDGERFTNGKTWAEHFAKWAGDKDGSKPSLRRPGQYGNYAFGGARARSNSGIGAPDSATQIAMYLGDYGGANEDALYVLQFGGNDLRDALVAAETDPNAAVDIIQAAIGDLAVHIQTLYFSGARNFMVANAPNLAHAPAVKLAGAAGVAGFFTGIYNGGLEGALQQLEMALPGTVIHRLDMAGFTDQVVGDPARFQLSITETPCLSFFIVADAICDQPDEYLFWDGLHPTTAAHKQLAEFAASAVGVDKRRKSKGSKGSRR